MSETDNLNVKLCPKCGFENEANYKFCIKCGTPLANEPTTTQKTEAVGFKPTSQPTQQDSFEPKQPAFNNAEQNSGAAFGSTQTESSEQIDPFKQAQNDQAQTNSQEQKSITDMFKEMQSKKQTQGFASTQRETPKKSRKRSPVSFKGIIEPVEVDTSHVEEVFAKGLPEWDVVPPFIVVRRKKK